MNARRDLDEMTTYLRQVLEYVGSSDFDTERRLARDEFFGRQGAEFEDESELLERCAAYYSWFMFDRPDSRRSQTPIRMYVERHPDLPERIRTNLLACEASVYSTFEVVEAGADHAVILDLLGEKDDYYRAILRPEQVVREQDLITARLVRWDGEYYVHGEIASWPESPRDVLGLPAVRDRRPGPRAPRPHPIRDDAPTSRRGWLRERRVRP